MLLRVPDHDGEYPQRDVQSPHRHLHQGQGGEEQALQRYRDLPGYQEEGSVGSEVDQFQPGDLR